MAPVDKFDYTFENMAKIIYKFVETIGLENYSLYMQDYGAPIGYRLFSMYPEKVKVKQWMQQLTCQVITLPSRE
jgi:pimeloyl-ACP methyl ester carboxylesterase